MAQKRRNGFGGCRSSALVAALTFGCACSSRPPLDDKPGPRNDDNEANASSPLDFDCEGESDECPMETGLSYHCKQRFALGLNYAWHTFAGDFGGAYGQRGVSREIETYRADLTRMHDNGVSVVRWWMFPDFRGGGVLLEDGDPIGLSEEAIDDIHAALELAEEVDVYLVLTLFSFDNFRPDREEGGRVVPGMAPMVEDPDRRKGLVEAVVGGAARAVSDSEYFHRLLGWDVMNEPEWAIQPYSSAVVAGQFSPNEDLEAIELGDMKALLNESLEVLRKETPYALLSVGWAAAKWQWAFGDVGPLDFHQPHIYTWVNAFWPYTATPRQLGYLNKPTVIGEFALAQMPFSGSDEGASDASFVEVVQTLWDNGYAGAWAWSLGQGGSNLPVVLESQEALGCGSRF